MAKPMNMENCNGKTRSCRLVLFLFTLMLCSASSSFGDEPRKAPERPSFGKFIQETISVWKKSHHTSWEKMKNIMHEMQLQFFPPNLDFRSRDDAKSRNSMDDVGLKGKMKVAVEKSFGASKDVVEESAKSAAKVVEEAVQKTADKMKENLSDKKHSHDEL